MFGRVVRWTTCMPVRLPVSRSLFFPPARTRVDMSCSTCRIAKRTASLWASITRLSPVSSMARLTDFVALKLKPQPTRRPSLVGAVGSAIRGASPSASTPFALCSPSGMERGFWQPLGPPGLQRVRPKGVYQCHEHGIFRREAVQRETAAKTPVAGQLAADERRVPGPVPC